METLTAEEVAGLVARAVDRRTGARLTQGQVATRLGVHRTTLIRWMRGISSPAPLAVPEIRRAFRKMGC